MTYYKDINKLYEELNIENKSTTPLKLNKEWVKLLKLLEKINHCNQRYELVDNCIIISYKHRLNIFNFKNLFPLKLNAEIIGFPVSISHKGYFGDIDKVKTVIEKRKGLKIILNSDKLIENGGVTLSSFIFYNKFENFNDYLNSLRSQYRRRLKIALEHREKISIKKINRKNFNKKHYELYISIMNRAENPLEILPIKFFQEYESEIYEFTDIGSQRILGFIQIKDINKKLLFLFGGFKKNDNREYDLYYNMLLKIVEIGIEKNIKIIEFGQTAEESKLKIGCKEKKKYLYIHHSNLFINKFIQKLAPFFSYKPYTIKHSVFKKDDNIKVENL
ncbi:MAG: hypothetical protein SCJ93_12155 [Bacillota bacterium]|nr:hypothetical protein [Bacillota bacterium]